jgi:hypothetical protein
VEEIARWRAVETTWSAGGENARRTWRAKLDRLEAELAAMASEPDPAKTHLTAQAARTYIGPVREPKPPGGT